jgi:glutamate dehydrogenase
MPFTVDSVLMALSHDGLVTHHLNNVVFGVDRAESGEITALHRNSKHHNKELFIHAEIDRVAEQDLPALEERLRRTTSDLKVVVGDFGAMKDRLAHVTAEIRAADNLPVEHEDIEEALVFLEWLASNNFTFLGYREFEYKDNRIRQVGQALGTLRLRGPATERMISEQPASTREFLLEPILLAFSKSGTQSRVHRPAYPDYVGVKRFDSSGNVIGECGFLGLYTSRVYMQLPAEIPVVRRKIANVIARSELDPAGFDGKVLAQVLATYPRDELFQIEEDNLFENSLAITYIHERRRIRVFTRYGKYGLFVACLVYMPRDLFNTEARTKIQNLLIDAFHAEDAEFDITLSESILVRLQVILRIPPGIRTTVDMRKLEARIAELVSDWTTELNSSLLTAFGETVGRGYAREYADAFPAGYREWFSASFAADDVASIEQLSSERNLLTRFYRLPEDPSDVLKLKVFHLGAPLPLSDIIPNLENLGLRVNGEHPYQIRRTSGPAVCIHDFTLSYGSPINIADIGERFEDAFIRTWTGLAEDDGYNRLILSAGLTWRQVSVLRAYARYMKQIRFGFSQEFISDTLNKHRGLAGDLIRFFEARFDPAAEDGNGDELHQKILAALEEVELLNEDRILRRFLEMLDATKRTNYFQLDDDGAGKPYLSIKVAPAEISNMPRPLPMFEVFVCAPYFEGVHLRGGMIARGGLRWSDRLEDYRTEVLGLVKAQVVKNGVIVPTGAKGGFVLKPTRRDGSSLDVVTCYRQFISGLLDLTDNIVDGRIVPPASVRRFDGDDPYLVVAADKGTATFSDEANAVAARYGFWMGDGFASGGSYGYDHKKMGITARGAWISVQRHFSERGIDVQKESITVLGIGDMGGDVFGNGMLLSQSLKLVAAFNHLHIFVDPDPDPLVSFEERQRLFDKPRSSWRDYDASLISTGGGVFERRAKSVPLSPEIRELFAIDAERLAPDELIHELLKAPVGLIWNGGIGTYVKASDETHDEVGDRANDHLRVDASQLRAQVFGEGGNLGITQRARIEFSLNGGAVNTDFIDNSAGVDCSDHEVNIKIALNSIVAAEDMTNKQRNELLETMTDSVAGLVLSNNRRQARTLSLAQRHSGTRLAEYERFIARMETEVGLDRSLEYLPSDDELGERFSQGIGFSRPELAVLLSYAKIFVKTYLVNSDLDSDPYVSRVVLGAFPPAMVERYESTLLRHRLRREVIASQLANAIVDHMGITFVVHMLEFVGGSVADVARCYVAFADSYGVREWTRNVATLESVSEDRKLDMLLELIRLGRRGTRWILRHRRQFPGVGEFVSSYKPRINELIEQREVLNRTIANPNWQAEVDLLRSEGVPEALALKSAEAGKLAVVLPIINIADQTHEEPFRVAQVFAEVAKALFLDWLTEQLGSMPSTSHWQAMERDSLNDEVVTHNAALAARVLVEAEGDIDTWVSQQSSFVHDWRHIVEEAQHSTVQDFAMFSMTCRKLNDLCRML